MFIKIITFLGILVLLAMGFSWFLLSRVPAVEPINFGVTFSTKATEDFDLNWREVYTAIFEDLGVSLIRIPVYWNEIGPEEGVFDFSDIDWMLEVAEKYDAKVILAVGRKLPRWPECHEPEWVQSQISNLKSQKLLNYIKAIVERYDNNPLVWAWQVENEPFLKFGECPKLDVDLLEEEIGLVKSLSDKPVILTDSGEFGSWVRAYKRADIFGSTLYRTVWNKVFGQITYPLPPAFFRLKRSFVEFFYGLPAGEAGEKQSFISELQAEPWGNKHIKEMSLEEQYSLMGPEKFNELMEYIKGSGFDTFYFWGVEWWYWLKEQDHPEMWELVRKQIS